MIQEFDPNRLGLMLSFDRAVNELEVKLTYDYEVVTIERVQLPDQSGCSCSGEFK